MEAHLPPPIELETKAVLKAAVRAHRYLAELKGISSHQSNQLILMKALILQEAKESCAIENIMCSHDEMYKASLFPNIVNADAAIETQNYAEALHAGYAALKRDELLTNRHIIAIQEILEHNNAGFRKLPGTDLKNMTTGETVYVPPQENSKILQLMGNLERYINDDTVSDVDPLVKLAVIHFQFESIHPFYDDNGRTGRIINQLYLVLKGLLDIPLLALSRYISQTKPEYYRMLQSVRDTHKWEEWILYILNGIEKIARQTIALILKIKDLMQHYKVKMREQFRFYSHDLLNVLFLNPYTKIELLERDLKISRLTATKYLDQLAAAGFLEKNKLGRANFYVNKAFFDLLSE